MPKRLTDTDIWVKGWFRKLPEPLKLFWFYVKDRCDYAGIWEPDYELASFQIGAEITREQVLDAFGDKIQEISGKVYLAKFIEFQYGARLNPAAPMHKKVLAALDEYGIKYPVSDTVSHRVSHTVPDTVSHTVSHRVSHTVSSKKDSADNQDDKKSPDRVSDRVYDTVSHRVSHTLQEEEEEKEKDKDIRGEYEGGKVDPVSWEDKKRTLLEDTAWHIRITTWLLGYDLQISRKQLDKLLLTFIQKLEADDDTTRALREYKQYGNNWIKQELIRRKDKKERASGEDLSNLPSRRIIKG